MVIMVYYGKLFPTKFECSERKTFIEKIILHFLLIEIVNSKVLSSVKQICISSNCFLVYILDKGVQTLLKSHRILKKQRLGLPSA